MRRFAYPVLAVVFAASLFAACARGPDGPVERPVQLRVMTFNIEWGGTHVNFANVVEAIRRSGANVVTVSEAEGNAGRIAAELGWFHDDRHYLVSRFPIVDPPEGNGFYAFVEVVPGRVVAVAHAHLPSDPYGPELVRDGAPLDEVLELERELRLPKIRPYLDAIAPLIESGIPVFLAGDFNSPAHTDWTAAMVGARPALRYAVDWPVSVAVTAAGLHDSWRTVHPDPATHPGLTWWARRPEIGLYDPGGDDPEDRIDFVWFGGPATALSSELVGEEGRPGVAIGVSPWVSDHRAVVSSFSVMPAPMPPLVSSDRRVYRDGDEVELVFSGAAGEIAVDRIGDGGEAVKVTALRATGSSRIPVPTGRLGAGHFLLRADDMPPREFWVLGRDAVPAVEMAGETFAAGETIPVRWRDGPGNRNDYLAVVDPAVPPGYESYATYVYVDARPEGEARIGAATAECCWPLPPGRYVVRLVRDDGYEVLAESAPFDVK